MRRSLEMGSPTPDDAPDRPQIFIRFGAFLRARSSALLPDSRRRIRARRYTARATWFITVCGHEKSALRIGGRPSARIGAAERASSRAPPRAQASR